MTLLGRRGHRRHPIGVPAMRRPPFLSVRCRNHAARAGRGTHNAHGRIFSFLLYVRRAPVSSAPRLHTSRGPVTGRGDLYRATERMSSRARTLKPTLAALGEWAAPPRAKRISRRLLMLAAPSRHRRRVLYGRQRSERGHTKAQQLAGSTPAPPTKPSYCVLRRKN